MTGELSVPWHKTTVRRPLPVRSGPSVAKIEADLEVVRTLRSLQRSRRYKWVIAHHVEAAAATWVARVPRSLFIAHTTLGLELPSYAPPWMSRALRVAGDRLDRALLRASGAVAAVSPRLARRLTTLADREVPYVPVPWSCPAPIDAEERRAARASLRLGGATVLYAGNLDGYQGWPGLVAAVARVREPVTLLVHTAADTTLLRKRAAQQGLGLRLRVVAMTGEAGRREAAAAATVAVVPRQVEGGVPIKLLDALARGVPTVVTSRATGGLPVTGATQVVADDPTAMAAGVERLLDGANHRRALAAAGRRYIAREHEAATVSRRIDAISTGLDSR